MKHTNEFEEQESPSASVVPKPEGNCPILLIPDLEPFDQDGQLDLLDLGLLI